MCFVFFSNIYLKANYKEEYIEYVLEKSFYDDFECLGFGGSESWMSNRSEYIFESQKFPEQKISVIVNDRFIFWDFKKWTSNYISIKYKTKTEELLAKLFYPIYGDCKVYLSTGFIKSKYSIKNLSFDEFLRNCLDDCPVQIITTSSLLTKNNDARLVVEKLEKNGIHLDYINIFYLTEELDYNNIEEYEVFQKSVLHGYVTIEDGVFETVEWNN